MTRAGKSATRPVVIPIRPVVTTNPTTTFRPLVARSTPEASHTRPDQLKTTRLPRPARRRRCLRASQIEVAAPARPSSSRPAEPIDLRLRGRFVAR